MESKEYSNSHAYKDYFSISCDSLCSGVVNKDSYNSKIEVEDLEMSKELEELKCMRERLHKIYFDLSSIENVDKLTVSSLKGYKTKVKSYNKKVGEYLGKVYDFKKKYKNELRVN